MNKIRIAGLSSIALALLVSVFETESEAADYHLIVRYICQAGDVTNIESTVYGYYEYFIVDTAAGEIVVSGTGAAPAELLAEYGLANASCAGSASAGPGAVVVELGTGGLVYNVLWFGLAGVAVGEGIYLGYLCYQYNDASCELRNAKAVSDQLDGQISQPIAGCNVQCPAGTFCSPQSGNTCWTQSGLGEGCGWSVNGQEAPIAGACAQGQCTQNQAGGYSCQ